MPSRQKKEKTNFLQKYYKLTQESHLTYGEGDLVSLHRDQDHPVQKFFRKLGFKIPRVKKFDLDKFASFVLISIDKGKNISEIGHDLEEEFGEAIQPLYPRLKQFIDQLIFNKVIEEDRDKSSH